MTQIIFPHSLHRLFDGTINSAFDAQRAASFAVDIHETDAEYRIVADLPGVAKNAVSVQVENNVLHIRTKAQSPTEQNENVLLGERAAGDMARAFRLSRRVDAENINATLKNGVLTITLPKAADAVSRKISVN